MSATLSSLIGAGGGKPKLITSYTSGTGTHVPTEDNARCFVRLQGGGGGGHTSAVSGGGGAFVEFWVRVPIAGQAYVVGAGGAVSTAGGATVFGAITANGPIAANTINTPGRGGLLGMQNGNVTATGATMPEVGGLSGVAGGQGCNSAATNGFQIGVPYAQDSVNTYGANTLLAGSMRNGVGNGSGGDSFYGKGGATGASPAATAYGAGGGINAAGAGGYIEIWDFGA